MTEPRPQPVVNAANQVGKLTGAAVVAVGVVVFFISHGVTEDNLMSFGTAVSGAVTAVGALVVWGWSWQKGRKTAAVVTPLEDPQTNAGEQLLTAAQWERQAAQAGKHSGLHAAPAIGQEPGRYYQRLSASSDTQRGDQG